MARGGPAGAQASALSRKIPVCRGLYCSLEGTTGWDRVPVLKI